jgi:heme A synthase
VVALLAQAFLLAVATLATVTAPAWAAGCDRPASTLRRGASVLVALTFVQILLGALVRHARSDLTLLLHAVGAVVVLVQGSRLAGSVLALERDPRLRRMASALGLVLLLQLALGLASYVLTGRPGARTPELTATAVIPTLHLVLGGVTLALARILTLRLGREPAASTRESVIRTPAGAASA